MCNDLSSNNHPQKVVSDDTRTTFPEGISAQLSGFANEEEARKLGENIFAVMRLAGKSMDLSGVDGVTVSFDYNSSLIEIDRGVEGLRPLSATDGEDGALGAGMSPAVLRDGRIKTHIAFSASAVWGLIDVEHEDFQFAAHLVYHECAHAAVQSAFDDVFPGVILKEKYDSWFGAYRGETIDACWQEYCVSRISAPFGEDPTNGYVEVFLTSLSDADGVANDCIRAYRWHG
ncbi:MAG: hypothetical protein AAFR02_01065, partial [Pseudomonadota bacterium]